MLNTVLRWGVLSGDALNADVLSVESGCVESECAEWEEVFFVFCFNFILFWHVDCKIPPVP